jgi:iron complex transport system substrate-binding protein
VERQKSFSFQFDGMHFDDAFCVDLLVDDRVVLELKSVEKALPVHQKQLLTYLRILDLPVGFLIDFGAESLNTGLSRVLNPRVSKPVPALNLHRSRR